MPRETESKRVCVRREPTVMLYFVVFKVDKCNNRPSNCAQYNRYTVNMNLQQASELL